MKYLIVFEDVGGQEKQKWEISLPVCIGQHQNFVLPPPSPTRFHKNSKKHPTPPHPKPPPHRSNPQIEQMLLTLVGWGLGVGAWGGMFKNKKKKRNASVGPCRTGRCSLRSPGPSLFLFFSFFPLLFFSSFFFLFSFLFPFFPFPFWPFGAGEDEELLCFFLLRTLTH